MINNKIYLITKIFLFIVNYSRKLRMEVDIRRKEKAKKIIEFVKRIEKIQKETRVVLRKT